MKIRNILLALTFVAIPATVQGQAQAQAGGPGQCADVAACVMNVTGRIASNVTASVVSAINFGAITAGTQTATGQYSVSANQPSSVAVVVTDMTNSNDNTTIAVTADCKRGADYATGTAFTGGACGATALAAGTSSLWVRGSITAGTAATAGNYTGTATLSVTYTSF